ncbi:MAG: ABC transporter permease [Candidatus Nanopelagicus sp.]
MQLLNDNEKINELGLYQGQGKLGKRFLSFATAFVITLSMLPLFYLIVRAIQRPFEQTADLLLRDKTFEVVGTTALLVVLVVVLTGIFGLAIASGLHFVELPLKPLLIIPAFLPLAIPSYVFTYTWIALIPGFSGFFAAVFILTLTTLPYVTLACLAGFRRVNSSQIEVARSLGLNYPTTFLRVVLPQIRGHLSGGLLLAGLYSMSDFGAVSLLNVDTLTVTIQNMYRASYDRTAAAVMSLVLIFLSALFVIGDEKIRQKNMKTKVINTLSIRGELIQKLSYQIAIMVIIFTYTLLAVLVPIYVLLTRFISNPIAIKWDMVFSASISTVSVALFGAAIAMVLSIPIGILFSEESTLLTRATNRIILIGHALPGVVIGLALVSFSSRFDLIYQTTFLLAFAYALLFLAKSVATMSSSLAQVPSGAKEVAATLGLSRWAVLKNVVAPISSPGIALGTTLVFLTAMKELPATLMLRPTGFETLATQIWSYSAINRFNEAAPYALILIAIAAIPTFILSRPDQVDRIQLSQGFGS